MQNQPYQLSIFYTALSIDHTIKKPCKVEINNKIKLLFLNILINIELNRLKHINYKTYLQLL